MHHEQSTLKRARQPMPEFVRLALTESELMHAYEARPPYQQNDYLLWINTNTAKRQQTKQKRLHQMLDELKAGGVYMNMTHPGSRKG